MSSRDFAQWIQTVASDGQEWEWPAEFRDALPVVVAFTDTQEGHTVFLIPVAKWSDGTPAPTEDH